MHVYVLFDTASGNSASASFGASVTLRFEIQNAIPAVQPSGISWTHDGSINLNLLSQFNGASLSFSSDYKTLTISNINCNTGGRFGFTATNVAGSDSSYIDLYLIGKYNKLLKCSYVFTMYAHTNIQVIHTHTHALTYVHAHTHACTHMNIHVRTYTHNTHVHTYTHELTCTHMAFIRC